MTELNQALANIQLVEQNLQTMADDNVGTLRGVTYQTLADELQQSISDAREAIEETR